MLTCARVSAVASGLFFCAFASDAYSQSFNCSLANTPDEVVVCHSSRLSALDEQMASLFFKLRTRLTGNKQQQLTGDQQSWLRERMSCGSDTDCIENAYKKRLNQLMPKPPGLHDLRLIEWSHVHITLGGPSGPGDIAQSRGCQVEA